MKPLKRTTALATIATSSLAYVPTAFAAGSSDAASTSTISGPAFGVTLAVVSAAAVAGFVGWGMEIRKRHEIEGDKYSSWMRNSLTGSEIDSWELNELLGVEGEHPETEPAGTCGAAGAVSAEAAVESPGIDAVEDVAESGSSTVNDLLEQGLWSRNLPTIEDGQQLASPDDELEGEAEPVFVGAHTRDAVARRKAQAVGKAPAGADAHAAVSDGQDVPYVPKHAAPRNAANDTFITGLEDRYSSILQAPRDVEEADGTASMDASAMASAYSETRAARELDVHAVLDSMIPSIDRQAARAEGTRPSAPSRSMEMTSADKVASALADRKSMEDAAAEIARAGKISAQASEATAKALRDSGFHAVVRGKGSGDEGAVVPVSRGPGFVDVNDDTFIREGAVGKVPVSRPASEGQLGARIPAAPSVRSVSCTDSVSDYPYSVLHRTYFTQGDGMVRVEYPQSRPSSEEAQERSKSRSAASASACLQSAAVLSSLPLV